MQADLTARELEVLRLLRAGRSNADIAHVMSIELGTAKNHVHNVLRKLGAHYREELRAGETCCPHCGAQLKVSWAVTL